MRLKILVVLALLVATTACGRATPAPANAVEHERTPERDTQLLERAAAADVTATHACNNRDYLPAAIRLIQGARREIDATQFLFVYGPAVSHIQRALGDAAARGVKVRILLDEESDKTVRSIEHLVRLGIDAKLDSPHKRTHTKLLIVDGARSLAGSTNWSDASLEENNESNLLIADTLLVAALGRYFETLWVNSDSDAYIPAVTSDSITVIFDRAYETAVQDVMRDAKKIDLQLYAARWYKDDSTAPSSRVIGLVLSKARRRTPVRAIVEESDYNEEGNAFNDEVVGLFKAAGVAVRRDPIDVTSHTKMVITDRVALVGSTNWGFGAFRQYHELNWIIANPRVAQGFRDYYDMLWSKAREK